jgi:Tol biopolymer transport system component
MNKKQKRRPQRQFFSLFILLLILTVGYFAFPLAQNAFINWWADDPLTPICDVPHLELVYEDASYLYRWHQGIQPELLIDNRGQFTALRWSPDFETLYMSARTVGQDYGFLLHANNDLEILPIEFRYWFWSPNGNYAAAISQNGNHEQLRIYDEQAGEAHSILADTIIAEGERIGAVSWSPNSQRIAFMIDLILHVFELSNSDWVEIFSMDTLNASLPIWSPDSEYLAYGLFSIDIYHLQTKEIIWTFKADMAWSWTEQGILVHLSIIDSTFDLGEPSKVDILLAHPETQSLEWLADTMSVWGSNTSSSSIIGWSVAGDALLFSPEPLFSWQLLYTADGEIYHFPDLIRPQFTPDGHYISYQGENYWYYLFDLENRKPCRLYKAEGRGFDLYTWRIIPQS